MGEKECHHAVRCPPTTSHRRRLGEGRCGRERTLKPAMKTAIGVLIEQRKHDKKDSETALVCAP